jgi:hypothetical protein
MHKRKAKHWCRMRSITRRLQQIHHGQLLTLLLLFPLLLILQTGMLDGHLWILTLRGHGKQVCSFEENPDMM